MHRPLLGLFAIAAAVGACKATGPNSGRTGNSGASPGVSGTAGYFPPGAWFYQDVSAATLNPRSAQITRWLADNGGWGLGRMQIDFSIEVLEAAADTPSRSFSPTRNFYSPDCDNVMVPIPNGGALEGQTGYTCAREGDCHLIVVDRRVNRLFEMWTANIVPGTLGSQPPRDELRRAKPASAHATTSSLFDGGCLAAWDMTRVYGPTGRGEQCTSADAAGFPIAPLLFGADEVAAGTISHVIRFILPNERMRRGYYVHPATHAGAPSADSADAPTYGQRWRLRANFPLDSLPNNGARVVARALQRYGMALADGGKLALMARSDRFTSAKWRGLLRPRDLESIQPADFEVVDTGPAITHTNDCVRTAY